jgi:hypothetical protein
MRNYLTKNTTAKAFKAMTFAEDPESGYKLITEDYDQACTVIDLYNLAQIGINNDVHFYINKDEVGRNYIDCNNSCLLNRLRPYIKNHSLIALIPNSFPVHQLNLYSNLITKNFNEGLMHEVEPYIDVDSSFPYNYDGLVKAVGRLNTVFEKIKNEANSPAFKEKLKQYHDQPNKNLRSNLKYIRKILDENPEVQVFSMELRQEKYAINPLSTEQELYDKYRQTKNYFKRFCNNIRSKKKLAGPLLGYTWSLLYTKNTGFSIHFLGMFDGLQLCDDTNLNDIGEYWKNNITGGQGGYYNHNANKDPRKYLGIGLIKSDDAAMRKEFEQLAVANSRQSDYFIKINHPLIKRTSGRGAIKSMPQTQ